MFKAEKREDYYVEIDDPSELYALGLLQKEEPKSQVAQAREFIERYTTPEYLYLYPMFNQMVVALARASNTGNLTDSEVQDYCKQIGDLNVQLQDAAEYIDNPGLLRERMSAHARAEAEARAAEATKVQARINPPLSINRPPTSSLQDVQRFIEGAIRRGNSYEQAIEDAYDEFPHSLVNQATGRS